MSDPSPQKALLSLPLFIGPNRLARYPVHLGVAAWQRSCHSTDGNRTALETDRHQSTEDPRQKAGGLDVHVEAVGPDRVRVRHHILQNAGLEVPASRVEPCRILAQGIKDFFHLEGGGNRLHQCDGTDGGASEPWQKILARGKEVSPETGFFGGLHLGQVEVDSLAPLGLSLTRMEQGQRRAQDAGRDGSPIHQELRLVQMQPPLTVHEEGKLPLGEFVSLSLGGVVVGQCAFHGALPVGRRLQGVHQAMACRVLVVVQVALGPESSRTRIQGIDEHPRDGGRARDLDPGLVELLRHFGNAPITGRGVAWRQMSRPDAVLERSLQHLRPLLAKLMDAAGELIVQDQQVVLKLGTHQLVGAWNRSTLDSTAHSLPSS